MSLNENGATFNERLVKVSFQKRRNVYPFRKTEKDQPKKSWKKRRCWLLEKDQRKSCVYSHYLIKIHKTTSCWFLQAFPEKVIFSNISLGKGYQCLLFLTIVTIYRNGYRDNKNVSILLFFLQIYFCKIFFCLLPRKKINGNAKSMSQSHDVFVLFTLYPP